ncbi:MAG: type II toxin-antitoxin system VapC family toxin [Methylococcaceae bacterium]|nr:type II toxin-antitoxin system VapC family toxin [Methylococcaceae bacterium]
MKYIFDTHALLWWWTDDPALSPRVRDLISDETNEFLVSAASAWEIATKYRLGKLDIGRDAVARFDELVTLDGFSHLPVSYLHALRAGGLLSEHRDPFDRMLAAQSLIEGVPLVTRDSAFDALGTATVW